ncbi:MAG: phosphatidylserine decarboxylase [Holosporaceae bacterium]|jgi:phosphatidylserine decarboxylase|nr:phosphatidylserine decarboxylase [Holosporaceae bacterium]
MNIRLPFDRDAWRFVGCFAVTAILLGHVSSNLGWGGFIATVCCLLFFRDPERVHPSKGGVIVSPADGRILKISEGEAPEELGLHGQWKKVSIFMSVCDVHVNRAPIAGVVEKIIYTPGKFFNADFDKASEDNERQTTYIKTADGATVVFVQIAGLLARRIRCDISEEQALEMGERVGIIRFGSRVDVYFPKTAEVSIEEGQQVIAGETILAHLKTKPSKGK